MWGKKPATRQPHPDPGKELELRRILDLRASIDRRAELIAQYRRDIAKFNREAIGSGQSRIELYFARAEVLHQHILDVEQSITLTGEEIAALQAKISPDDLAYL